MTHQAWQRLTESLVFFTQPSRFQWKLPVGLVRRVVQLRPWETERALCMQLLERGLRQAC